MTTTADHLSDPKLLATEWDLSPLAEPPVEAALDESLALARAFSEEHAGRVAELDSAGLAQAMGTLARIHELVGKAGSFASLRFSTDTADSERGALLARVQERGTEIETHLLFFDLEWAAVEDAQAERLLSDPLLEFCRHHLRSARRSPPH